jgi:hypothetical protein
MSDTVIGLEVKKCQPTEAEVAQGVVEAFVINYHNMSVFFLRQAHGYIATGYNSVPAKKFDRQLAEALARRFARQFLKPVGAEAESGQP